MKSRENNRLDGNCQQTQRRSPDDLMSAAQQQHEAGQLRAAEASYRQVLAQKPSLALARIQLGEILIKLGRLEEAVRDIKRALKKAPSAIPGHVNLGIALGQMGQTKEAIASFERVLRLEPMNVNALMNLAILFEETGSLEEAVDRFRQVIQTKPDLVQAYIHLARMKNYMPLAEEIDAMRALYNRPDMAVHLRIQLAYGLGSALEKHAAYKEAFDFFEAGHSLQKPSSPFSLEQYRQLFESLEEVFNEQFLAMCRKSKPGGVIPIFIFGMPRSGTTLAEQILASHPDVYGAGEKTYIEELVRHIIKMTGKRFPEGLAGMKDNEFEGLGARYITMLDTHADGVGYCTDTTPMNFLHAGLIACILPHAKMVHCVRNSMDTCLSIYQQPLSKMHSYAHDMKDLGGFYLLYQDLMRHWHGVLPGRIHDLRYEELVADSETQIRNLLDYCGLPFHEGCLDFHKSRRSVRTPSVSQVRQPIYAASVGRWRRYEDRLEPLLAVLQQVATRP